MSLLPLLTPDKCAAIAIDCLNTFIKVNGELSISTFQAQVKQLKQDVVQKELDEISLRMGELRRFLYERKIPQVQFQDAHVVESIHGRRYHSLEIVREQETPDFLRTFPPHALLEKNRRYGTPDQQAIDEIEIPAKKKVFIRWFDTSLPVDAILEPSRELIFMKDDFCMSPGSPFVDKFFWELRRQGRFFLIVFGVCDEICNLRNVLLMLAAIFNVVYVTDCTYPLAPEQRSVAINYMQNFNPLGAGATGQFETVTYQQVIDQFSKF